MERGAWQPTVYRVTKNGTRLKQLSMHTCKEVFLPAFRSGCPWKAVLDFKKGDLLALDTDLLPSLALPTYQMKHG